MDFSHNLGHFLFWTLPLVWIQDFKRSLIFDENIFCHYLLIFWLPTVFQNSSKIFLILIILKFSDIWNLYILFFSKPCVNNFILFTLNIYNGELHKYAYSTLRNRGNNYYYAYFYTTNIWLLPLSHGCIM